MRLVAFFLLFSSAIACIPMQVTEGNRCSKMTRHPKPAEYCLETEQSDKCEDAETTTTSTTCKNSDLKLIIADKDDPLEAFGGLKCIGMHWFIINKDSSEMLDNALVNLPVICVPKEA